MDDNMGNTSSIVSLQHFHYVPPVRFLRVATNINAPLLLVPVTTDAETEDELLGLSLSLTEKLKGKLVGLDLDFYPMYIHDPVADVDMAREYLKPADALRFYKTLKQRNDSRALDVSFVADSNSHKRHLKYSRFPLSHKHLHPMAKKYYRVLSVECKKLYEADEWHFNEAGFTYAPHHLVKRKLNSRLVDSIESVYRDHRYKAKADSIAAFITVVECTLTDSDRNKIQEDLDNSEGVSYELYTLFN